MLILILAFKAERQLEVWGAQTSREPYHLIGTYPVAAMSGTLGPKTRQGDKQVPEGFYSVAHFDPHSQFHLALDLDYPNKSDRLRAKHGLLGSEIGIHGGTFSIGCFAMTDPVIDEIYPLAVHAKGRVPVAVFPCRLTDAKWRALQQKYAKRKDLIRFWSMLRPGYVGFEKTHLWVEPRVDARGDYVWK